VTKIKRASDTKHLQIIMIVYYKEPKPSAIEYKIFNKKIKIWRIMPGHLTVKWKEINVIGIDRMYTLLE
jgi:hypothetical protein